MLCNLVWNHMRDLKSDKNCTTWSSITTWLSNPVWNSKFGLSDKGFCLQIFYWSSSELVCRKLQKLFFIFLQFDCFLCKQVLKSDWLLRLSKASLLAGKICDFKSTWINCTYESQSDYKDHQKDEDWDMPENHSICDT